MAFHYKHFVVRQTATFLYAAGRTTPIKVHGSKKFLNVGVVMLAAFQKKLPVWHLELSMETSGVRSKHLIKHGVVDPIAVTCCRRAFTIRNNSNLIEELIHQRLICPSRQEAITEIDSGSDLYGGTWPSILQPRHESLAEFIDLATSQPKRIF